MGHRTAKEGYRVLITAPYGRDADSVAALLKDEGYDALVYPSLNDVAHALDDRTGAILLTEEALPADLAVLSEALEAQPDWSDIPFILLTSRQTGYARTPEKVRQRLPDSATTVVLLERPLGTRSLISAIASAMRSRQKQFEMRDRIQELARSRKALEASEAELRLVTDSLPVLIAFVDRDYRYRFANKAYESWFYLTPEEVVGRSVMDIAGEEGFLLRRQAMEQALMGVPANLELPWPHRDGRPRMANIRYLPRRTESGEVDGFHVFVLDITEQKQAEKILRDAAEILEAKVADRTEQLHTEMANRARAEAALRQSHKMEAVGQLTGGIAHDFNNMLTGIIGSLDIMKRRIAAGKLEDLNRFMDAASSSAYRAAALTQRLLAFSRRQSLDSKAIDINGLVGSLQELLSRTLSERIALKIVLGDDVPPGIADANQLESSILNLAINARDAMPDGGTLTVETSVAEIDQTHTSMNPEMQPGRYVVVDVSDTGVGMSSDLLEKVFEPFFTTKPIGQGTGLGLSMVYGFAKQSNGQVLISSRPGEGTSVKVYLPAADTGMEQLIEKAAGEVLHGSGQAVLVVEDDASVRLLIRDVLEELGYTALEAQEAQEAIPILTSGVPLDLIVSDVGLPGMNGRQLAEVARQHRPEIPILFVTGYAENAAIRAGFLGTNMHMITKPFTLETLAEKVGEILKGQGPDAGA